MSKILTSLSLHPATLERIEAQLRDGGGEERQPAPRKFVVSDERDAAQPHSAHGRDAQSQSAPSHRLAVWTGQEPGERIANTILLCAIRDRAHQVTLEPQAKGVRVRFEIANGTREQKLPAFALEPIVRHFKALASESDDAATAPGTESDSVSRQSSIDRSESFGQVAIAVDEQLFHISFSPLPTQWGAGVKVQFSSF